MVNVPQHTIYLQDGTLFTFERKVRLPRNRTLLEAFANVRDCRSKFGKRYPLSLILFLLFFGITKGSSTIKECYLDVLHDNAWFFHLFPAFKTIPDPTVISDAIQKVDIDSLIHACLTWKYVLYGESVVDAASFDGKTMRAVHGARVIRHILTLFTHGTHQILGQAGVNRKENEIPAFRRLLKKTDVSGLLLVGDALHTQRDTVSDILEAKADYLLFAKDNQETLVLDLQLFFTDVPFGSLVDEAASHENTRKRAITTTAIISHDKSICAYLETFWEGIQTIGKIKRLGQRVSSDGEVSMINETVYCIASRKLSAEQVLHYTRGHWEIENNLHWTKDWVFLEDRQTLRLGNAPLVMTFLRSLCISLFALWSFASVTDAVHNFQRNPKLHHTFLRIAGAI